MVTSPGGIYVYLVAQNWERGWSGPPSPSFGVIGQGTVPYRLIQQGQAESKGTVP